LGGVDAGVDWKDRRERISVLLIEKGADYLPRIEKKEARLRKRGKGKPSVTVLLGGQKRRDKACLGKLCVGHQPTVGVGANAG